MNYIGNYLTKWIVFWFFLAILFVNLDRFLKVISLKSPNYTIIPHILEFSLAKNYFIAFSLPLSGIFLNYLILLIIIILLYLFLSTNQLINKVAYFFIIIGASSNLFDRIKYGYVIDYFNLKWFTVFNIADVMIVGAILFLFLIETKNTNPSN